MPPLQDRSMPSQMKITLAVPLRFTSQAAPPSHAMLQELAPLQSMMQVASSWQTSGPQALLPWHSTLQVAVPTQRMGPQLLLRAHRMSQSASVQVGLHELVPVQSTAQEAPPAHAVSHRSALAQSWSQWAPFPHANVQSVVCMQFMLHRSSGLLHSQLQLDSGSQRRSRAHAPARQVAAESALLPHGVPSGRPCCSQLPVSELQAPALHRPSSALQSLGWAMHRPSWQWSLIVHGSSSVQVALFGLGCSVQPSSASQTACAHGFSGA